jgi:hypothetical protein
MWIPPDHGPASTQDAKGRWDEAARGREDDRCIQRFRRRFVGITRPCRAEAAREVLRFRVAGPGEGEDLAPLVPGDLRDDMRGCAKSIKAEPLRVTGQPERAIADETCTKQRRGRDILERARQRETKTGIRHGEVRVAAIDGIAGEPRTIAQVLTIRSAEFAFPASPAQPRNAHTVTHLKPVHACAEFRNATDNFVADDER